MAATAPLHRLTIASFGAPVAVGHAIDALNGVGLATDDICLACAPATAGPLASALSARSDWQQKYTGLVKNLQPTFDLGNGTHAIATPDRLLTRLKAPASGKLDVRTLDCVVPPQLRTELVARLCSGATLVLAAAENHGQHIACQRIMLAHSADRVQGHRFSWPPKT
jgi:hypothetical protein